MIAITTIKDHKVQIFKFGLYGLLKNLRFFEPYMIIYFIMSGLNLFLVGLLFSIREIIIFLFEVPSGVLADRYGKKSELVVCFLFYILSFVVFFLADSFYLFAVAMSLFALGEAFRSGTHKSMIMAFIDKNDIFDSKTKIYGLTRSYSLIGSMIASLVSIALVLILPEIRYLFLVAIVPYLIDLVLILSYPNYLNDRKDVSFSIKSFLKHAFKNVKYTLTKTKVRITVFSSASYQAMFKSIKDYIQPILIAITFSTVLFANLTPKENTKVYLGIIYAVLYLMSSIASKNAYKTSAIGNPKTLIRFMWLSTAISVMVLSLFLNSIFVVALVFLVLYITTNIRRPIMVERIAAVTDLDKRASVLSVETQTSSLLVALFAPLIGLLAQYSMSLLFLAFGLLMLVVFAASSFSNKFAKISAD